jgi:PAS domain S-box-containing protein
MALLGLACLLLGAALGITWLPQPAPFPGALTYTAIGFVLLMPVVLYLRVSRVLRASAGPYRSQSCTDLELQRALTELGESEQRLRLALEGTADGIWDWSFQTGEAYFSPRYYTMLGYAPGAFPANYESWHDLVHPDDIEAAERGIREGLASQEAAFRLEFRVRTRDGGWRWILGRGKAVERDEAGRILRIAGSHADITELKRTEEALRLTQFAMDRGSDGVFRIERDGRFVYVNEQACRSLGYGRDELLGMGVWDIDPNFPSWRWTGQWEAMARLGHRVFETQHRRKDGTLFPVEISSNHLEFAGKEIHVAYARDITERKRVEERLRNTQFAMDSSPDAVFHMNRDGVFAYVNAQACRSLGYAQRELLGMHVWDIDPDYSRERWNPQWDTMDQVGRRTFETRHRRKDGTIFPVEISTNHLRFGGEPVHIAYVRDISDRKRAEQALRDSEYRFRAVVENAQAVIFILDAAGVFQLSEGLALAKLGLQPGQVVGASAFELYRDNASITDSIRSALDGHLERTTNVLDEAVFESVYSPYRDAEGRVKGVVGVAIDVTEQRRAEDEVRRLNAELELRVQKRTTQLEAANRELETFTYSVSHDLKAPLRGIDGYSKLLLDAYGEHLDEDGRYFLNNVRRGAQQMGQLIEDLLAYSRLERRALQAGLLSLSASLDSVLGERAEELQARGVQLNIDLPFDAVVGDPDGLAQVLRNLLDNALKFTRDAPHPSITIGGREEPGAWIVWIKDNGIGFDAKFGERIFEIFQRLQRSEDYPGTGIGLTIVRKAMQHMNGRVWAESEPGRGATFFLELPEPAIE